MEKINPCPFCGGTKIRYSTKTVFSSGIVYIHSTFYCTTCRAYGPRVTSPMIGHADHHARFSKEQDEECKAEALEKWNSRDYKCAKLISK